VYCPPKVCPIRYIICMYRADSIRNDRGSGVNFHNSNLQLNEMQLRASGRHGMFERLLTPDIVHYDWYVCSSVESEGSKKGHRKG